MKIPERLESLRRAMDSAGIDIYIITGSDPHGSEYPPSRWRTREWISGFTGSAGTVIVSTEKAGLWTDFRYWIQASEELHGTGIDLYRDGSEGVPKIQDWIADLSSGIKRVGVDGRTVAVQAASEWEYRFRDNDISLITDLDLIEDLWTDRPRLSEAPVIELDEDESGESRTSRIGRLNETLKQLDADTWLGIGLDSVAWLLNVRGGDVPYNPVVTGFLIHSGGNTVWYTNESRLPETLITSLFEDGIQIAPYEDFFKGINELNGGSRVLLDSQTMTRMVVDQLPEDVSVRNGKDPVVLMKARKNSVEADRISRAMEKDGVAMVRFLMALEQSLADGKTLNELDAAAMLSQQRSSIPGFLGESFSTIPAVGAHGAIIHYKASSEGAFVLKSGPELFLIDSGGQWEEGTTDITRTVVLGNPTDIQKKDYTLTLKGHINLAMARFPKGTRGYQLDVLARTALWEEGIDFGHGAGHGVGYRLNVHEGPQRLSPAPVDVALEPGMVVSNEPGVYREGSYGIRIENLLICRDDITTEFGDFLCFNNLTLAPYDHRLIDTSLLNEREIRWINEYQDELVKRLSPMLESEEQNWLRSRTAQLN